MNSHIKIRKGLNIRLKGEASQAFISKYNPELVALVPDDFPGLLSKPAVQPGDKLKVGSTVFFDKYRPEIKFVSPVAGTLTEVVRGEKRKILYYLITPDQSNDAELFQVPALSEMNKENVVEFLCNCGLWPTITQRPYGTIPNTDIVAKDIYISFYDTSPLAPDYDFILHDKVIQLTTALQIIKHLTSGKIHLGFKQGSALIQQFKDLNFCDIHTISGPHPAGNVGTIINKTNPINKGEYVFTLNPQDLLVIGETAITGTYYATRTIALTGSELKTTGYCETTIGAALRNILKDNIISDEVRVISGNVLTGTNVGINGFLGYKHSQVSVIPEGRKFEMLGWMKPGLNKFSNSHTYFTWLFPKKKYRIDTNLKGGVRNLVMTGQYEKVCPIDIYPQQLIKAIIVNDIDKMEQLGIYEVIEEDLALCEFVCTSKTEVQSILREGLTLMKSEMN